LFSYINSKGECDQVIQQYGDQIIQWLESGVTPDQVCQQIDLCPQNGTSSLCSTCETLMFYVEMILQDNSTAQEVLAALEVGI
jgi:hypothetical protein